MSNYTKFELPDYICNYYMAIPNKLLENFELGDYLVYMTANYSRLAMYSF